MWADRLRGEGGGGVALEIESFVGPCEKARADRRVLFGAHNTILLGSKMEEKYGLYLLKLLSIFAVITSQEKDFHFQHSLLVSFGHEKTSKSMSL
jgi:hypothetical protein